MAVVREKRRANLSSYIMTLDWYRKRCVSMFPEWPVDTKGILEYLQEISLSNACKHLVHTQHIYVHSACIPLTSQLRLTAQ